MDKQFSKHRSSLNHSVFSNELANATGPIDYGFTNDYMFRAIPEKHDRVESSDLIPFAYQNGRYYRNPIQNPIELGKLLRTGTLSSTSI